MKTRLLIITVIAVFTSILINTDSAYAQVGVDVGADLSPSFASFEQQIFSNPI